MLVFVESCFLFDEIRRRIDGYRRRSNGFVMTTRGEAKRREHRWGEAGKLDLAWDGILLVGKYLWYGRVVVEVHGSLIVNDHVWGSGNYGDGGNGSERVVSWVW